MDIQKEINAVIVEKGVTISTYDFTSTESFYQEIYAKYHNGKNEYPLWDNLKSFSSIYNREGWRLIGDFIAAEKCLLFLDKADAKFVIELPDGSSLNTLLEDTTGFVFYVSNRNRDFLICFNDHDYLLGMGTAGKWIDNMSI